MLSVGRLSRALIHRHVQQQKKRNHKIVQRLAVTLIICSMYQAQQKKC